MAAILAFLFHWVEILFFKFTDFNFTIFFFFSYDKKFLLKTMNDNEMHIFKKILPEYLNHLKQNPNSLIARIYGIFTVNMEELVPVHILLMSNAA